MMDTLLKLVPEKYAAYGAAAIVAIQIGGRIFHALASGNGLIGAWRAFLYGTNVPKPASQEAQPISTPGAIK